MLTSVSKGLASILHFMGYQKSKCDNIKKQEALSNISSVGQWAYTEYSSFSGPPKGE